MRTLSRLMLTAAIALGLAASTAVGVNSAPIAAYSVAAPASVAQSGLVARAIVPAGATCPALVVDGRSYSMSARLPSAQTSPAFAAILTCTRNMPAGASSAAVGGLTIPATMPKALTKMVMFGDSGCRIKPPAIQDCSTPAGWPLARISRQAAIAKPDLVVFIGDFFYREAACPGGMQDWCANSPAPLEGMPFTDSAYGWIADVLMPMAPVMRVAPMVMTRGNHEECSRAGAGFFLMMDPRPGTTNWCDDQNAPVTAAYPIDVPLGGRAAGRTLRLVIGDSANGNDFAVSPAVTQLRTMYQGAYELAAPHAGREAWLVSHRPIFGLTAPGADGPVSQWLGADQEDASAGLLGRYGLLLSSHIHVAESVQVPGQPGQLVLGNGGTLRQDAPLSIPANPPLTNLEGQPLSTTVPPFPQATALWGQSTFGFAVAAPGARPGRWSIVHRDDAGRMFGRCTVGGRTIACAGASR